jgi:trimeric autotransporter adhesin
MTPESRIARRAQRAAGVWIRLLALGVALHLGAGPAHCQHLEQNLWGADRVSSLVRSGNTLYVSGGFYTVGPNTGSGVPVDRLGGNPLRVYPRVTGSVNTVVSDGEGGWYVGGWFVAVGGLPHSNLAHILAGGTVAPWSPDPDAEVLALVRSGQTLYVGGRFTSIGGQHRNYIAAVGLASGVVTDWNPSADAQVRVFLVSGRCVYVGGDFSNIGGQVRHSVAALDPTTGLATAWDPDVGMSIRALAEVGDTIYVGGDFEDPHTHVRFLEAVDSRTGQASTWDARVVGPNDSGYYPAVNALAAGGNTLYLGGQFTGVGGQVRGGLAQIDLATGQTTSWNPDPGPWGPWNRDITAIALADTTMYVAGLLQQIAGETRNFVAEVSLSSGAATPWNPNANNPTNALAIGSQAVYVGGTFTSLGPDVQERFELAAFDATTGALKDWNPTFDGLSVERVLAVVRGSVYVSGYFDFIGGKPRYMFAALDTLTGAATDWDPMANGMVTKVAAVGDTLYVGGWFTSIGGQTRHRLASFDLNTMELTSWSPDVNDDVDGFAVKDTAVYVVGWFSAVGGLSRRFGAAAVNAITGAVEDWNPQCDDWPAVVAVVDSTVYVGGVFKAIGGQPRHNLAALDARTGLATDWIADANSDVVSLLPWGDTLFVGGGFRTIGGQTRMGLAALDLRTGAVLPWDADFSSVEWSRSLPYPSVTCLRRYGSTLYVGGTLFRSGLVPLDGMAAFNFEPPPPPPPDSIPERLSLAPFAPNPVHTTATIRFALPAQNAVDLEIFDVQGRRVATLLDHALRPPGLNVVTLNAACLRDGFYFCRLRAGGSTATRKFVVLR